MAANNAAKLTLYTYPDNFRCHKILVAAEYAGLDLKIEDKFDFGTEPTSANKQPYFLRNAHPLGKVPVLETSEGCIFESFAILRYIARQNEAAGLYGKGAFQNSQVDQWLDFAAQELTPFSLAVLGPLYDIVPHNPAAEEEALKHIKLCLAGLDLWLETRTFLVGERITAADIAVACTLLPLFQLHFTPDAVKAFTHLQRWFNHIVAQPVVQKVLQPGKLLQGPKKVAGKETKPKKK